MTARCKVRPLSEAEWRDAAAGFADRVFTQAWGYSHELARRQGARCEMVGIFAGPECVGAAGVRIRSLPLLGAGLAYVSGGPLCRRERDADLERLAECVEALREEYVERQGHVLRVRLPLGTPDYAEKANERMRAMGWVPVPGEHPYRTLLLDVQQSDAALRAGCTKKWRSGLSQASRAGLTTSVGTQPERFEIFRRIYREMSERKAFRAELDAEFYAALQPRLVPEERLEVRLAQLGDAVVAGTATSSMGDSCVYVLGASSAEGRDAQASYLLLWESILASRERGLRWLDLGGVDPEGNPGVARFKQGISRLEVCAPGPFQALPGSARGRLVLAAERLYRRLRRA